MFPRNNVRGKALAVSSRGSMIFNYVVSWTSSMMVKK
jgi:hypothetical protein